MARVETNPLRTCRLCKKQDFEKVDGKYRLVKYSTRHWAHGRCLVATHNRDTAIFMLPQWQKAHLDEIEGLEPAEPAPARRGAEASACVECSRPTSPDRARCRECDEDLADHVDAALGGPSLPAHSPPPREPASEPAAVEAGEVTQAGAELALALLNPRGGNQGEGLRIMRAYIRQQAERERKVAALVSAVGDMLMHIHAGDWTSADWRKALGDVRASYSALATPTQDEADRFMTPAIERVSRKHPQLLVDGALPEKRLANKLLSAMIVWMSETPGWESIP